MTERVIGRKTELSILNTAIRSDEPELIVLYGRRRIGKTHLIRFGRQEADIYFEITGQRDADIKTQLGNFSRTFGRTFYPGQPIKEPSSWNEALDMLANVIDRSLSKHRKPTTLFFDEAPWLDGRRSGFLNALEYFWNAWASQKPYVKLVVCGSSAGWVVNNILKGKGGWHRRVTRKIHLKPFTLEESRNFLAYRNISLSNRDIIELYMILGGVPLYLKQIERGESISQAIDRICFSKDGLLFDEYSELFTSLFNNSEKHEAIVRALAKARSGLTRKEISEKAKIPSGGGLSRYLQNLEQSDFVQTFFPLNETSENKIRYRLVDLFTFFHLTWIKPLRKKTLTTPSWINASMSRSYNSWSGFTFETACWNHANHILNRIGLGKAEVNVTKWRHQPRRQNEEGAQVDLLFDVKGSALYILEMKWCSDYFVLDKKEKENLIRRKRLLTELYRNRRSVFVFLCVSPGCKTNNHLEEIVDHVIAQEDLFH